MAAPRGKNVMALPAVAIPPTLPKKRFQKLVFARNARLHATVRVGANRFWFLWTTRNLSRPKDIKTELATRTRN